MRLTRSKLALFASTFLISAAVYPGAASAQGSGDAASSTRDVITVTARKREENLQDVPIAITALTADNLRDANTYGLEDVAQSTPGLVFRPFTGFPEPTIRGLSQVDQTGIQGQVGVFIDGVFLNNRSSIEFGNLDIAQIEVLKGPQSALFGRNTFAGAINYRTRGATLEEFDATIEGEIGSDERRLIKGSVNIPLNDFGAIRFFGGASKFDGTIPNLRDPDDNVGGWEERTTYGASALFEHGRFRLKGFYTRNEIEDDSPAINVLEADQNTAGSNFIFDNGVDPANNFFTLFEGEVPYTGSTALFPAARGVIGDYWMAYGNLDIDLDFATLTLNYSHSESEYSSLVDNVGDPDAVNRSFAGTPFSAQLLTNSTGDRAEQDSFEVRLASNADSAIQWLIGYSHFDSVSGNVLSSVTPLIGQPDTLETITFVPDRLAQNIDAVFASFSAPITDRLNLSGEVRYTDEDQVFTDQIIIQFRDRFDPPISIPTAFEFWTGRAALDYSLNDDVLLYASAARGLKSGGVNQSAGVQNDALPVFLPETNWTYEAGVKATLWDGRALINAAVFYIDWNDLQTLAPAELGLGPVVFNGIGASSKGFELDATVDVTEKLQWRLATAYSDPTYNDGFIDETMRLNCSDPMRANLTAVSLCSNDVGGNQLARSSKFQVYTSATYTEPDLVYGFDGFIRGDFSYESESFATSLNLASTGSRELANLRVGLKNDNTQIAFWVDNVFDAEVIDRITSLTSFQTFGQCGSCARRIRVIPGNTRTWGVRLTQSFN